jgi:hypothetical protein
MAIQEGGFNPPSGTTSRPWLPAALAAVSGSSLSACCVAVVGPAAEGDRQARSSASRSRTRQILAGPVRRFDLSLSDALKSGKPVCRQLLGIVVRPVRRRGRRLQDAARRTDGQVTFVGVNVQDVDADAQAFMSKYTASRTPTAGQRRFRSSMGCAVSQKRTSLRPMGAWCANGTP